MRHLPFGIAGARLTGCRSGSWLRNGLTGAWASFCMGLMIAFAVTPHPRLDGSDDGLTAWVNVDVLHRDLPLAAILATERLQV